MKQCILFLHALYFSFSFSISIWDFLRVGSLSLSFSVSLSLSYSISHSSLSRTLHLFQSFPNSFSLSPSNRHRHTHTETHTDILALLFSFFFFIFYLSPPSLPPLNFFSWIATRNCKFIPPSSVESIDHYSRSWRWDIESISWWGMRHCNNNDCPSHIFSFLYWQFFIQ